MNNLAHAIETDLLPWVNQPGQYIGLEINARWRPPAGDELAVAMCFPDAYAVGVSHHGSQLLYAMLNGLPGVHCDRAYCPPPDGEQRMRDARLPLFGWESRAPLAEFDLLAFSVGYEGCVTNVLTMLDLAGVPLRAADRRRRDPIVVCGDALADSPEPIAPFFDLVLPGDGETPLAELARMLLQHKRSPDPPDRQRRLLEAARTVPSAYAPQFYENRFDDAGQFAGLARRRDDVPATIPRACVTDLADSPVLTAPLVPVAEAVHDRVVIEVMRGCPNGCRFCQAGATRLPVRLRPPSEIVDAARQAIDNTGYDEIALLSLSTSDYPQLAELIGQLQAELGPRGVSISLPSLRVDTQLKILPELTADVRKGGLTIAAEAGSERLRQAVRKRITEQAMLDGVTAAWQAGYRSIKVYFLAGLPGETMDDIDAIADLCRRLAATRRDVDGHWGAINASVSWLVPKPHTPMQWSPMRSADYFWAVRQRLIERTRRSTVNVKFHYIERSLLEGLIVRGDRRLADVIENAWRRGARMDSWTEHFDWSHWQQALDEAGLELPALLHRPIPLDAPLPWDHITCHRDKAFLQSQHQQMLTHLQP